MTAIRKRDNLSRVQLKTQKKVTPKGNNRKSITNNKTINNSDNFRLNNTKEVFTFIYIIFCVIWEIYNGLTRISAEGH